MRKSERHIRMVLCAVFIPAAIFLFVGAAASKEEKTYSITLTRTADAGERIQELDGKRVLSETHVVQKGDYLWKVLRDRGLLDERNLPEILTVLKQLNPSLQNLDLIHPGEKIAIPLKIVPVTGAGALAGRGPEVETSVQELKEKDLQYYTVRPGDSLSKVVMDFYRMPSGHLYGDYLGLVRKLNPEIKDINAIYPGQKIRLPVYSPQGVRMPVVASQPVQPEAVPMERPKSQLALPLSGIFGELGEEWIQSGQQFIPLRSGGQVDLKAESYPFINLRNGRKIILDINNALPEKMGQLIESSWSSYRVVPILKEDGLSEALRKILAASGYAKVLERGDGIELQGEISFKLGGDWVVQLTENASDQLPHTAVINLERDSSMRTPKTLRDYLALQGVEVIEYPKEKDPPGQAVGNAFMLDRPENPRALIQALLYLTGRTFSKDVEIPVYQSQRADAKLAIKADYFLKIGGDDAIIDLTGFDAKMASFLKDHAFRVLTLAPDTAPLDMVASTLRFLGVDFTPGAQTFEATPRDTARNIQVTLQGVMFSDHSGRRVLSTSVPLPEQIAAFLGGMGYKILPLPKS